MCGLKQEAGEELRRHQESHLQGQEVRVSSDPSQMTKVLCKLCPKTPALSKMRSHVKTVHGVAIQEYKETHSVEVEAPVLSCSFTSC